LAERVGKRWREDGIKERQREHEQRIRTVYSLTEQATESFRVLHESWQSLNQLAHTAT
jgi:DNA-binding HxlR family transcriptional regulator